VIAAEPPRSGGHQEAHVQGWLVSVLLHGTVALAAILFVKQIQLAPQDEPFKWNVAIVSTTQQVQSTASVQNQAPTRSVPSTTSTPSPPPAQQMMPAQTPSSPQPPAQQTTPSISERAATPATELPAPPRQPTAPSLSRLIQHNRLSQQHETVAPMVAESTSSETGRRTRQPLRNRRQTASS
jgi:hypothetical protein